MENTQQVDVLKNVRKIFSDYMQNSGLRKTPERFAILDEIYSATGHFDAESLTLRMKKNKYSVSRATVYNTLEHLLNCELIAKHQFGQHGSIFEKSYAYHQHDHLICSDCEKVFEFCDPRLHQIQTTIGKLLNFSIAHHSLNLYGKCNVLKNAGYCENYKNKKA